MFTNLIVSIVKSWGGALLQNVMAALAQKPDPASQVAMEQIKAEIAARQTAESIRRVTAGYWEMRLITFLIAGCFTLHLCVITADTVFKLGLAVPKFPSPFDEWEGTILCSFFAVQGATVAVRSISAAILRSTLK